MTGGIVRCDVSLVGILAGAITGHFVHAIWYMKLFSRLFVKYYGWDEEETKKRIETGSHKGIGHLILGSFISKVIYTVIFAILAHNIGVTEMFDAIKLGVLIWFGFMATVCLNEVLWHGERIQFYLINQGCYIVSNIATAAVYTLIAL